MAGQPEPPPKEAAASKPGKGEAATEIRIPMIEFKNPPPAKAGRKALTVTPEIRAALSERPGEWALVFKGAPRNKGIAVGQWARRNPEFECTTRGTDPVDIYLRRVAA